MEKLLKMASDLGRAIREHERYRAIRESEEQILKDPEARKIQEDYEKQFIKIRQLEQEQKPVEVEDKRELQRLHDLTRSHPGLQKLLKAQADYFELMNNVNNAILLALAPEKEEG